MKKYLGYSIWNGWKKQQVKLMGRWQTTLNIFTFFLMESSTLSSYPAGWMTRHKPLLSKVDNALENYIRK